MEYLFHEKLCVDCSKEGVHQACMKMQNVIDTIDGAVLAMYLAEQKDWVLTVLSNIQLVYTNTETYKTKPITRLCIPYRIYEVFLSSDFIKEILILIRVKCSPHLELEIEEKYWEKYSQILNEIGKPLNENEYKLSKEKSVFCYLQEMKEIVLSFRKVFDRETSTHTDVSILQLTENAINAYKQSMNLLDKIAAHVQEVTLLSDFTENCRNYIINLWYISGLYQINSSSHNITQNFACNVVAFKEIYRCYTSNKLIWSEEYDDAFFELIKDLSELSVKNLVPYNVESYLEEQISSVNVLISTIPMISLHVSFFQNDEIFSSEVYEKNRVIINSSFTEEINYMADMITTIDREIQSDTTVSVAVTNEKLRKQEKYLHKLASSSRSCDKSIGTFCAQKRKRDMPIEMCKKIAHCNKAEALYVKRSIFHQERLRTFTLNFMHQTQEKLMVSETQMQNFYESLNEAISQMYNVISTYIKMIQTGTNLIVKLRQHLRKCQEALPYSEAFVLYCTNNPCISSLMEDAKTQCQELDQLRNIFRSCINKNTKQFFTKKKAKSIYQVLVANSHIIVSARKLKKMKTIIREMDTSKEYNLINSLYTTCIRKYKVLNGVEEQIKIHLKENIESFNVTTADEWIKKIHTILSNAHQQDQITKKDITKIIHFIQKQTSKRALKNVNLQRLKKAKTSLEEKLIYIRDISNALKEKKENFLTNDVPRLKIEGLELLFSTNNFSVDYHALQKPKKIEEIRSITHPVYDSFSNIVKMKIISILRSSYEKWVMDQIEIITIFLREIQSSFPLSSSPNPKYEMTFNAMLLAVLQNVHREEIICVHESFQKIFNACNSMAALYKANGREKTGSIFKSIINTFILQMNQMRENSTICSLSENKKFESMMEKIMEIHKVVHEEEEMLFDQQRLTESTIKDEIQKFKEDTQSLITEKSNSNQVRYLELHDKYRKIQEADIIFINGLCNIHEVVLYEMKHIKSLYVNIISLDMWQEKIRDIEKHISSNQQITAEARKSFMVEFQSAKDFTANNGRQSMDHDLNSLNVLLLSIVNHIYNLSYNNFKTAILTNRDICLCLLNKLDQENDMPLIDISMDFMDHEHDMIHTPDIDFHFSFLWKQFEKASNIDDNWQEMNDTILKEKWTEECIQVKVKELLVEKLSSLYQTNAIFFEKGPISSYTATTFFSTLLKHLIPNPLDSELYKSCQSDNKMSKKTVECLTSFRKRFCTLLSLKPEEVSFLGEGNKILDSIKILNDLLVKDIEKYTSMPSHHPLVHVRALYNSCNSYFDTILTTYDTINSLSTSNNSFSDPEFVAEKRLFHTSYQISCHVNKLTVEKKQAIDIKKTCEAYRSNPCSIFTDLKHVLQNKKWRNNDDNESTKENKLDPYDKEMKYVIDFYVTINKSIEMFIPILFEAFITELNHIITNISDIIEYMNASCKYSCNIDTAKWYYGNTIEYNYDLNLQYLRELCNTSWKDDSLIRRRGIVKDILLSAAFHKFQQDVIDRRNKHMSLNLNIYVCNDILGNAVIPGASLYFNTTLTCVSFFPLLDCNTQLSIHSVFIPQAILFFNINYPVDKSSHMMCPMATNDTIRTIRNSEKTAKEYMPIRTVMNESVEKSKVFQSLIEKDGGLEMGLVYGIEYFIHIISSIRPFQYILNEKEKLPLIRAMTTLSLRGFHDKKDIVFNPHILVSHMCSLKHAFFDKGNEGDAQRLLVKVCDIIHLVQIFILSFPPHFGPNPGILREILRNFFSHPIETCLLQFIHLMMFFFKVYIAYKHTYNLTSPDGLFSAWGYSLSDYNVIVDVKDNEKFQVFNVEQRKMPVLCGTNYLFIRFIEMALKYLKNVETLIDALFRTAGDNFFFFELPYITEQFDIKSTVKVALSFKALVTHNISCQLGLTDGILSDLWSKFGTPGVSLRSHIALMYGIKCVEHTEEKPPHMINEQNDAMRSFYLNPDQLNDAVKSARYISLAHNYEICHGVKWSLFDLIIISIYSGINFSVCQEVAPTSQSNQKYYYEKMNTTYKPNIRGLSDPIHLLSSLEKNEHLPLSRENIDTQVATGMVGIDQNLACVLSFIPISKELAMRETEKKMTRSQRTLNTYPTIPIIIINQDMEIISFAVSKHHIDVDVFATNEEQVDNKTIVGMSFPIWTSDTGVIINEKIQLRIHEIIEQDKTWCTAFFDRPLTAKQYTAESTNQAEINIVNDYFDINNMDTITERLASINLSSIPSKDPKDLSKNLASNISNNIPHSNGEKPRSEGSSIQIDNDLSKSKRIASCNSRESSCKAEEQGSAMGMAEEGRYISTRDKSISTDELPSNAPVIYPNTSYQELNTFVISQKKILSKVYPLLEAVVSELS